MKVIVKPTSSHMYVVPSTGETIEFSRPSVVTSTEFVNTLLMKGSLKGLATGLSDIASDKEFVKFLKDSDGDVELAVQSFVSKDKEDAAKIEKDASDKNAADKAAAAKTAADKAAAAAKAAADKAAAEKAAAAKAGAK